MDFSEALQALKRGEAVTRDGWNGAGQFVYFVPENKYPAITDIAKKIAKDNDDLLVPYNAYFALKTVQNTVAIWVPSSTDLLANDWEIIEVKG